MKTSKTSLIFQYRTETDYNIPMYVYSVRGGKKIYGDNCPSIPILKIGDTEVVSEFVIAWRYLRGNTVYVVIAFTTPWSNMSPFDHTGKLVYTCKMRDGGHVNSVVEKLLNLPVYSRASWNSADEYHHSAFAVEDYPKIPARTGIKIVRTRNVSGQPETTDSV